MKKRVITMMALTAVTLGLSSTSLASMTVKNPQGNAMVKEQSSSKVNLNFFFSAKNAKLVHQSGKNYQLVIPVNSIKTVYAVSEKPSRVTYDLTPAQFAQIVHSGKDSFESVPPNCIVSFKGHQPNAFVISGFDKTPNAMVYKLTLFGDRSGPAKAMSGDVDLFIDAVQLPSGDNYSNGGVF